MHLMISLKYLIYLINARIVEHKKNKIHNVYAILISFTYLNN